MNSPSLTQRELDLIASVLRRHPEVKKATLFGSRAKGTHRSYSDVDIAVKGVVSSLGAEAIAAELDELPLPYRFEVQSFDQINHQPLREHIQRVGLEIYRLTPEQPVEVSK